MRPMKVLSEREFPLVATSRHAAARNRLPLCPHKRTFASLVATQKSALLSLLRNREGGSTEPFIRVVQYLIYGTFIIVAGVEVTAVLPLAVVACRRNPGPAGLASPTP